MISYLVILGTIIPISLYVSIEFIKFFQSIFIEFDALMYSKNSNIGTKCMSLILHEDLSKIDVIFCDKTGTLTKNELKLEAVYIGNQLYNSKGENLPYLDDPNEIISPNGYISLFNFDNHYKPENHRIINKYFFECLCLCNNSFTLIRENRLINTSTDEEAFVNALSNFQTSILKKNSKEAIINYNEEIKKFEILRTIEFTSQRKCMSVIVKNELNEIILFIKGADEIILSLIDKENICLDMNKVLHMISDSAVS